MKLWHYQYSGLDIASELPLPEWAAFEVAPSDTAEVRFSLSSPAVAAQTPDNWFEVTAQHCCLHIPEIAVYQVISGAKITITPLPNAGMREVRLFLIGSAWGALCYQRGRLPLHASVIRVGESAVAFCGDSGAGKSSLAAAFLKRDYALISDDLCLCDFSDETTPKVWPSTTRLKLWHEALEVLGWEQRELERDHFRAEKFHLSCPESGNIQRPVPLRAIYLLQWGELALTRLKGSRALHSVVENATYRGELIDPATQVAAHWKRCAQMVSKVPVWEFSRPRDWEQMEVALEILTRQWSSRDADV